MKAHICVLRTIGLTALLCVPILAFADAVHIDNLYYELDIIDRTASVAPENRLATNYQSLPTEIEIPSEVVHQNVRYSVSSIGEYAFAQCTSIYNIILPSTITKIGKWAFSNTSNLQSIELPNSLTSIDYCAFSASGLTELNIPESVTEIGRSAFQNCTHLTELILPSELQRIEAFLCENTALTRIEIPQSVWRIEHCAFHNAKLDSVFIPNKVDFIGELAFYQADSQLRSLIIEDGDRTLSINYTDDVTDYYDYNAAICKSDSVYIGRNIKRVDRFNSYETDSSWGYDPFISKTIAFGDKVTSMPTAFFSYGTALEKLYIGKNMTGNLKFTNQSDGALGALKVLYIADSPEPIKFESNSFLKSPLEYVYIGRDIWTYNDFLKKKVELTEVKIGNYVSTIPDEFMYGAINVKELKLPNSVTKIGRSAFAKCWNLEALSIGNGVSELYEDSFEECTALSTLMVQDSDLPLAFETNKVFADAPLETLYLGRPLTYPTCEDDGYSPFYGKSSLTSAMVGSKVSAIPDNMFAGCENITSLYSYAVNPPVCGDNALTDIDKSACTLFIPSGCADDYKTADQWKDFLTVMDELSGIETVTDNAKPTIIKTANGLKVDKADNQPISVYSINGMRIRHYDSYSGQDIQLPHGLYIVRVSTTSCKVSL